MKKILRLCLVPLMALMSSSNLFAMETQPITQESEGLTANSVTYNVSFSNYTNYNILFNLSKTYYRRCCCRSC